MSTPEEFSLRSKINGCTKCSISATRCNILCGKGTVPADIMIVTDSPTPKEDEAGEYFVGPDRGVFSDIISLCNAKDIKFYVTSLVKCSTGVEDKKPLKEEIDNCSEYFNYEVEHVKPKIVITLGDYAAKLLIDNRSFKIASSHGGTFYSEQLKCSVIPTFSISSVVKTPALKGLVVHDFKKAIDIVRAYVPVGLAVSYKMLNTDEEIDAVIEDIRLHSDSFAFDIETNGEGENQEIVCFTFSNAAGKAYLIPILKEDFTPTGIDWKRHLSKLFSLGKLSVAHNGKFDVKMLKKYGINTGKLGFDTMLAHFLIDENMPHGLKDLAVLYTDMGHYSDDIEVYKLDNKITADYRKLPDILLYPYAMKDADCTYRLYTAFLTTLKSYRLDRLFFKITMPLQNILLETEYRGVKIDLDHINNLEKEYQQKLEECQKKLNDKLGRVINVNSTKQLRELLYTELKLPILETTKTGPSTDADTLKKLSGRNPIVSDILEIRETNKLISTYFQGLRERSINGIIHTEYNLAVARTGRLSSKNPNLQNIPHNDNILNIFEARPGYTFVYGDYDQMEFKLLGHYSEDAGMIHGINKGFDVHAVMASMIFEVPLDSVTDSQRNKAKTLNYSIIYGAGPFTVAAQLGISEREATALIKRFFQTFPSIQSWMNKMKEFARTHGYVINSFGRRRNLPHIDSVIKSLKSEAERAAINSPVQGLSADLVNFAVVRLQPTIEKFQGFFDLHVHDSLTYEIPDEYVEQSVPLIKQEMERLVPGIKVNLTVSMKTGKKWGSLIPWGKKPETAEAANG